MKKLKLLCIADQVNTVLYSNELKNKCGQFDAILSCGDLKEHYYDFIVSTLNIPFLYVLGNHSQFSLKPKNTEFWGNNRSSLFQGGIVADGKSVYLKELDLIVVGLGGSIRYNNGTNQYTEFQMFCRIMNLLPSLIRNRLTRGRYLDILMTHAPPRKVNDREDRCHQGFKIFRWFIRKFKPTCMIHGHIHLYNRNIKREAYYEDVPVINVFDRYVLTFPLEDNGQGCVANNSL